MIKHLITDPKNLRSAISYAAVAVVVTTAAALAAIENPDTGSVTVYRRFNKPALGPLGDSLG